MGEAMIIRGVGTGGDGIEVAVGGLTEIMAVRDPQGRNGRHHAGWTGEEKTWNASTTRAAERGVRCVVSKKKKQSECGNWSVRSARRGLFM